MDQVIGTDRYVGTLPVNLDANDLDEFLGSLIADGFDADVGLVVLADTMEFFASRGAIHGNPLKPFATGATTRKPEAPSNAFVPQPPSQPTASPPPVEPSPYRTVQQAIDYFFGVNPHTGLRNRRQLEDSSLRTYLPRWVMLAKWLERRGVTDIKQVKRHHKKSFVDSLGSEDRSMKPQTKNGYIAALRALWAQIVDDGCVAETENPTDIKPLKVSDRDIEEHSPLTVSELAALLNHVNAIEDEFSRRSYRALILTEAFGGPRASEAVSGNFSDIDWATGEFRIRRGKGGAARPTVLIQAALDDLAWLKVYRQAEVGAALFVNLPRGRGKNRAAKRISKNTAWRWLSRLGEEVGIHLHNHLLRHSAGTCAEQFGGPAYRRSLGADMQKSVDAHSMLLLGHRSAAVNRDYNHIPLSEVRKVMELAYDYVVAEAANSPAPVKPGQAA